METEVILSGLPGKMAKEVALALSAAGIPVSSVAFSSAKHSGEIVSVADRNFRLYGGEGRNAVLNELKRDGKLRIVVDYTKPDGALENVKFYCDHNLPFVMGTSGFSREEAQSIVAGSSICAVMAVNMAPQIVLLQAMLEQAAAEFPGALQGFSLELTESHQSTKVDKSGIGSALCKSFEKLGAKFTADGFISVRDRETQLGMGIPEEALSGHAYHSYKLKADDGTSELELVHNVRGRKAYALGTVPALKFLIERIQAGENGKTFSMRDVLRG